MKYNCLECGVVGHWPVQCDACGSLKVVQLNERVGVVTPPPEPVVWETLKYDARETAYLITCYFKREIKLNGPVTTTEHAEILLENAIFRTKETIIKRLSVVDREAEL